MINHDVVWFDVSVHDPPRMTEIERFQKFENIVPHVVVRKFGIEYFEVCVVNVFKNDGGRF